MATTNKLPEGSSWNKFIVTNVTEDRTITVTFAQDLNNDDIPDKYQSAVVTTAIEGDGSVDPDKVTVGLGENVNFTVTPDSGYALYQVKVGDNVVYTNTADTPFSGKFSLEKVLNDTVVTFVFSVDTDGDGIPDASETWYTISLNHDPNTDATIEEQSGEYRVKAGKSATVDFSAISGYAIDTITIDETEYINNGQNIGPNGENWASYTFENVSENHSVSITGASTTDSTGVADKYKFTVTPVYESSEGTITLDPQLAVYGSNITLNIEPNEQYAVDTIVDGDTTYINDPEYVENVAVDGVEYDTVGDAIAHASNGSTILIGKDISEAIQLPAGKSITINAKNHSIDGKISLDAQNSGDVSLTVKNANIIGNTSNTYGVYSGNQTDTAGVNHCDITLEDCTIDGFESKGIYLTNAKSLTLRNCTFKNCSTVPMGEVNVKGDYVVDLNLVNSQDVQVLIDNCTFENNGADKAVIKIAARGGASDADATDIPKLAESTVSNVTISNCSFTNNEADYDFNIGTTSKTAGDVENTTGAYPVTISNVKTSMKVNQAYDGFIVELDAGDTASKTADGNLGMQITASESSVLEFAAGNAKYNEITLGQDIDLDKSLDFSHPCTIDGSDHTINANVSGKVFNLTQPTTIDNITINNSADAQTWNSIHGMQLYGSKFDLTNVSSHGNNAGLYINSGNVTLNGTIDVSNNTFGGIGVGKSSSEGSVAGVLNINGATIVNTSEAYGKPTIWIDGNTDDIGIVTGADSFTMIEVNKGDSIQKQYYLDPSHAVDPSTEQ